MPPFAIEDAVKLLKTEQPVSLFEEVHVDLLAGITSGNVDGISKRLN